MQNNPKILIWNEYFSYDNSTGITISKIIDHLPKEDLALLSINANISNIDIFGSKFQITKDETNKELFIEEVLEGKNINEIQTKNNIQKINKILRKTVSVVIGNKNILFKRKYKISLRLKKWLSKFAPDYIYLNPNNIENCEFAILLANETDAKIIIHVMDDLVNRKCSGIIGELRRKEYSNKFKKIVQKASVLIAISEEMQKEYKNRYGLKFTPLHNPIDTKEWIPFCKTNFDIENEIIIIYSGYVTHTAQPILELCKIIEKLNGNKYKIKLLMYSKFANDMLLNKIEKYSFVKIKAYVEQKQIPSILTKADILFLPLSFEQKLYFTSLSMPTKTAEYMISGVPILLYAPKETALAKYALKGEWANVVINNSEKDLMKGVIEIIENKELRMLISENAVKIARLKHDVNTSKELFNSLLQ